MYPLNLNPDYLETAPEIELQISLSLIKALGKQYADDNVFLAGKRYQIWCKPYLIKVILSHNILLVSTQKTSANKLKPNTSVRIITDIIGHGHEGKSTIYSTANCKIQIHFGRDDCTQPPFLAKVKNSKVLKQYVPNQDSKSVKQGNKIFAMLYGGKRKIIPLRPGSDRVFFFTYEKN